MATGADRRARSRGCSRRRGSTPRIVNPTPWPDMFDFLLGDDVDDQTSRGSKALRDIDLLIVLDISDVKRLGNLTESVRALTVPKLVIDHHQPSDDPAGTLIVSDTTACATAELVYDLAMVMGWEITPAIARSLYTGCSPTPAASGSATRRRAASAVAGQLLACGVDPEEMYTRIYASAPAGRVRLMAEVLGTLQVDEAHGLSWLTMRRRRARAARREGRGSRRHRRARALDRGHAHGAASSATSGTAR